MTGQRYIDEVLLPMFVFSVVLSVINLFYGRQRNMSSNTRCSGLSRQRGYSTSRMASAFSRSKPHLKMCKSFGEASCWSKLSSDKQEHPHPCTTEEWDKLPQQLLYNIVQSMVRRVECCITLHRGHIPY
ncbi:hypothetical protein TNCV_1114171 [Trichonephila clavipes]|nr:hypothetical protein TNCV_1114171 [Trichonephila clavipes]